jgi:hypothetical protein
VRFAETVHKLRSLWMYLVRAWQLRRDNYWLATVAVPLAMLATALTGLWWAWVLMLAGAAACTPGWRWAWVLTLELGVVGGQWAYTGSNALAAWPADRMLVGALWGGFALALAIAGWLSRRGVGRR